MTAANLTNKLIIFACCLTVFLGQDHWKASVVSVLVSVSISAFASYFDSVGIKTALTLVFTALTLFYPSLVFFLPLIAYDIPILNDKPLHKYRYINLLCMVPLVEFLRTVPWPVKGILPVLLLLSLLVSYHAWLLENQRSRLLRLSDRAREMAIRLEKQNRELLEKQHYILSLATLNERNRIAREIHDNVGHLLSSAILQSGALLALNRDERLEENLKNLSATLSQAMDNIRASVHELYDESIDLETQIRDIVNKFDFCEIHFDYGINTPPEKKLQLAIIFILKEALTNVMKHSNATHAELILREHPAFYQLIVRDNGTNISQAAVNEGEKEGMGLKNITDRVLAFNGNINIKTDDGFTIFITFPRGNDK